MIHVCISGSLGTGVDPGDRAEAEDEENEEVRSVGMVFFGAGISRVVVLEVGWLVSRRIAHPGG